MTSQEEFLREQIERIKIILAESQDNLDKNPDNYSARLLLMTTENYLADLVVQLDRLRSDQ
ncbi:MAG: hypothetical protein OEL83_07960 [Desulforhopalus sp.]|nr:hypothetical protein [Desulforhopalus sp.]